MARQLQDLDKEECYLIIYQTRRYDTFTHGQRWNRISSRMYQISSIHVTWRFSCSSSSISGASLADIWLARWNWRK